MTMNSLFTKFFYLHWIYLYYLSSETICASLEAKQELAVCERVHRLPSTDGFGCGKCMRGYIESDNYSCVSSWSSLIEEKLDCPHHLDCETHHREPCDESTEGRCGHCLGSYIEIADVCISEEGADRAIRTLEELLAIKEKERSEQLQEPQEEVLIKTGRGSGEVQQPSEKAPVNSVKKPVSLHGTASQSKNGTQIPASRSLEGDQPAKKRIVEDKMVNPLSEGNSQIADKASVGFSKLVFFCIISSVTLVCIISIVFAGVCWYRLRKVRKSMRPAEYQGYGGGAVGPKNSIARSESGSRKLAHSAQMYHYKHQKEQMALESSLSDRLDESEGEADENEEGNYTVYECPGLAPAGEMEVSNPLFHAASGNSASSVSSPGSFTSPLSMVTSDEGDN
ncbi:neural proliferation differentiation and control protein 1-like isoform X2 [Watersipora subatra]|uniref:neural proliferation differentiation and control protein 1-like isoform X2 n=1 Tax=Watersipora subatra TaxID=2589382 RepID=UPI00355C2554